MVGLWLTCAARQPYCSCDVDVMTRAVKMLSHKTKKTVSQNMSLRFWYSADFWRAKESVVASVGSVFVAHAIVYP